MDNDKFPLRAHKNVVETEEFLSNDFEARAKKYKEYEEAAIKLNNLVFDTKDLPFYIHSFQIHGTQKTRRSLFESVIYPALQARTLGSVIDEVRITADKLNRLDIFKHVDVLLDNSNDPFAQPGAIDVILSAEEKSRFWIKTGTEIGNDAGSANISLNVRNVFGGAETLETYMSAGTQTSYVFEFCLAKPINGNPDSKVDISAYRLTRNNQSFSSHDEILQGIALRWRVLSKLGFHELTYGTSWRQICNIASDATLRHIIILFFKKTYAICLILFNQLFIFMNFSIRESAGHSLKSSVTHTLVRDMRDDIMLPSRGYYVKLFQEFAGFNGDVYFAKNEFESQINFPLGKGFILSASLRNGLLFPFKTHQSKISDRFFLGGAQSVRGFKLNGIGPRENKKDSLGGDVYVAAGVSLFTPLPKLTKYPVKGHFFVNGGSLVQINSSRRLAQSIHNLTKTPSVSAGVGVVYRSSILRLEVNFCLPLIATNTDKLKKGLQLGLGFNFW
ncbi:surface antigen-domain-containing protein [Glomus cerebriforme]|uniref:Surface antigen-domain-containing protein n=1 Tax=Glomus cerebriforme TaxID=658196 RepID=A0A397T010_9GLOM|nr:surface antigen-domain-containing protein [Glomus cerebriforme]